MGEFSEVYHHRMRYFLTPQFDIYRNVRDQILETRDPVRAGSGISVLDYGCGNGVGTVLLDGNFRTVCGVDSDKEAIAFSKDAWGHLCTFIHADWGINDDVTPCFDVVVCLEVIEHVDYPCNLLRSLARLGCDTFVMSTVNHNSQFRKNRGHVGKFCIADFREMLGVYFPGVKIFDYTLEDELDDDSSISPMVAVWRKS
jgi:2-polyprenyl-3-methyl-5-hydroxy-6-metoxy-1,4-benzoquinol methylase